MIVLNLMSTSYFLMYIVDCRWKWSWRDNLTGGGEEKEEENAYKAKKCVNTDLVSNTKNEFLILIKKKNHSKTNIHG